ncbi:MAG: hypothetical protein CMH27_07540 [Micavibrio sp.]|nr:hypothetical protein [Micavibrio sp.]|tara:strand:+ start:1764 stop:2525 length:762 start_codon:yes stop_codon:yes gene_type:complete
MAQEKVTPITARTETPADEKSMAGQPVKTAEQKPAGKSDTVAAKKKAPEKKKPAQTKAKKAATTKKASAPKKAAAKKTVSKSKAAKVTKAKAPAKNKPSSSAGKAVKSAAGTVKNMYLLNTNPMMEKMMTQGKTQFDKLAKDATDMNREHVEACVKSSTIFAKGCEDMMKTMMSIAQSAAERQGKFFKEAMSAKTLNEWTEVQNKIAQTNFDDFMSSATKLTEMSVKVLNEAVEPINAQVTKGIQQASKSMAA